ncbi:MAG: hypothetical protein U0V56_06900 [Actinomycetota bacterium]
MSDGTQIESLLALAAGLIEWSETAGIRGDHSRLWRRHGVLLERLVRSFATAEDLRAHVLRLEVTTWIATLQGALLPHLLQALSERLAPGQSGTWSALQPERRRLMDHARIVRSHSSMRTFASSVRAFRTSPSTAHLHSALGGLEQLIDVERPRTRAAPAGVSALSLGRLVDGLRWSLPPVALEFIARMAEGRFLASIDPASLTEIRNARTRSLERRWRPTWEGLEAGHARVEDSSQSWFVPEVQLRYEELRLVREVDHAHADALVEDRHRSREIADLDERHAEAGRLAREEADRVRAEERRKKERTRLAQLAKELAKRNVTSRLLDQHLTLKHLPEPDRIRLLRGEEARLLRKWG